MRPILGLFKQQTEPLGESDFIAQLFSTQLVSRLMIQLPHMPTGAFALVSPAVLIVPNQSDY